MDFVYKKLREIIVEIVTIGISMRIILCHFREIRIMERPTIFHSTMSERIVLEFEKFSKSLRSLEEAIDESKKKENHEKFEFFRDSVIQRFEYTIEQAWKLLKHVLFEME